VLNGICDQVVEDERQTLAISIYHQTLWCRLGPQFKTVLSRILFVRRHYPLCQ
jgi:hypothetical protein